MKRNVVVCSKKFMFVFLCITFLFTSCGKDKTIEKIIYGDSVNNGDNILNKEQFNSVVVSRKFNNIDDFHNYIKQCYTDKKLLSGTKFEVKGPFNLRNHLYYNNEKHYYYKKIDVPITSTKPTMDFTVVFVDTNLNSDISIIENIVFIVNYTYYYYDYEEVDIHGYSYI